MFVQVAGEVGLRQQARRVAGRKQYLVEGDDCIVEAEHGGCWRREGKASAWREEEIRRRLSDESR